MPSPHTLGSIMHQPLAAPTPLLLFPLENRTSTHPPSTPVRPLLFPAAPLVALLGHPASVGALPSLFLPLFLSLSLCPSLFLRLSLSHSRASQVQQKPTPPPSHHPWNFVSVQRGVGSHPPLVSSATISTTPLRRRSMRCVHLSLSLAHHVSLFLCLTYSISFPLLTLSPCSSPLPRLCSSLTRSSGRD